MTSNDNDIYLVFIEIEEILDNFNIEYESLDNRIEFFTANSTQIIVAVDNGNIIVFREDKSRIFTLNSSKIELFKFIKKCIES
tara:strand:- start:22407 stop:22655 length:249 start_codon:yes stop_codon:yes gene_type:complete